MGDAKLAMQGLISDKYNEVPDQEKKELREYGRLLVADLEQNSHSYYH